MARKTSNRASAKPPKGRAASAAHKPAAASPVKPPAKPRPTMPVHALADDRAHLALKQPGRLKQGYLKTLCGLLAVSALSPFALADDSLARCKTCFGKIDKEGRFGG